VGVGFGEGLTWDVVGVGAEVSVGVAEVVWVGVGVLADPGVGVGVASVVSAGVGAAPKVIVGLWLFGSVTSNEFFVSRITSVTDPVT